MKTPNLFKTALQEGRQQIGIWNSIGGPTAIEILAGCGYDWILIDTEHTAIDTTDVLPALQILAAYPATTAVVRPTSNDAVTIKRLLDYGAQTLLIPYVQTAAEARAAVGAMRYAPRGIRGFAGLTRATRFGRVADYATTAEEDLCLLVQVETMTGIDNLDEIAAVDGVDGVFIGPADLAATMGHPGNAEHPEVIAVVNAAIERLKALGVPSGILTTDTDFNRACIARGTTFTAVGLDHGLLQSGAMTLRAEFPG